MTSDELEDLEDLVKHPGWLRLTDWAKNEWTARIAQHTEKAANEVDDVKALHTLRQVLAAKNAVELVLGWPVEKVRQERIKAHAAHTPTITRGGF